MKRTIFDLCWLLVVITMLSWCVRMAAGAEPQVEVTTTASGLTIIDASEATGKLTWSIRGDHEILFGGTVVVCRFADYTGALVSVQADGTVAILLLPIGGDTPPPPADNTLTDNVRRWSKGLPNRAAVAAVHSDLADEIAAGEIKTITTALALRRERIKAELDTDLPEWASFFDDLGDELDALRRKGKLVNVKQYGAVFSEVAGGLK